MPRLQHLDALRGFIMLLMALDHASYFIAHVHPSEFWSAPLPHYASTAAFLTRFVSHLCAPGFFFLAGAGVMLFAQARLQLGWTANAVRKHYIVRGLLLVLLQVLVENQAWALGSRGGGGTPFIYVGVLYGLGASMAIGVLLFRLPAWSLLGLGVAAVVATQVIVPGMVAPGEPFTVATRLMMVPGRTSPVVVFYPLIPWAGLTLTGMAYARLLPAGSAAMRPTALCGAACLLVFLLLRLGGGFGNTHTVDTSGWIGLLSVTKYPPSLTFVLLTLGLDLLLLALFAKITGCTRGVQWLLVFGQCALFFYLAHLYLNALMGRYLAPAEGTGPVAMYGYWAVGLAALYPLCRWYGAFKRTTAPGSLWRFF
jgi:uncharacterized membrane protein